MTDSPCPGLDYEPVLREAAMGLRHEKPVDGAVRPGLEWAVRTSMAERGFALFVEDGSAQVLGAVDARAKPLPFPQFKYSRTVLARVLGTGSALVTSDALLDERLGSTESITSGGIRSVLAIPARVSTTELLVLYLDSSLRSGVFKEPVVTVLDRFAGHLAFLVAAGLEIDALRGVRRIAENATANLGAEPSRARAAGKPDAGRSSRMFREVVDRLRDGLATRTVREGFEGIVWRSTAMASLIAQLDRVVDSPAPLLILGETGTGKEVVASAVHRAGPRAARPFCAVNCAAIAPSLLEAELFGHTKGAFTGAERDRPGLFEQGDGGTVFLDEVGELKVDTQAGLLRVLESQEVRRIGDDRGRRVDFRLIAATNRDLDGMVRDGRFREDLYYRINVLAVRVPPLRERPEDIPALCEHFLGHLHGARGSVRAISEEALRLLADSHWPGNVRELRNVLIRADSIAGERIEASDVAWALQPTDKTAAVTAPGHSGTANTIEEGERNHILDVLRRAEGCRVDAARILGIDPSTLWRKIKKHRIGRDEWAGG